MTGREAREQLHHVTLNVANLDRVREFYRAALAELGFESNVDEHGRVSFGVGDRHAFGLYGNGTRYFERTHVAFTATSRAEVDAFYRAGLAAGGRSLDGPRLRPEFGSLYSAYLVDPEDNVIEITFEARGVELEDRPG